MAVCQFVLHVIAKVGLETTKALLHSGIKDNLQMKCETVEEILTSIGPVIIETARCPKIYHELSNTWRYEKNYHRLL